MIMFLRRRFLDDYAEGRGIRIDIKDDLIVYDIKELIGMKMGTFFYYL